MVVCFQRSYWRGSMFDSAGFGLIKQKYQNRNRISEKLLIL